MHRLKLFSVVSMVDAENYTIDGLQSLLPYVFKKKIL